MRNTRTQMRKMRDKEFLAVYRTVVGEMMQGNRPVVRRDAIRRTIERGKPLFYLSYNRAYTVMLHYIATGDVPLKGIQRGLWLEVVADVKAQMVKRPYLSLPQAIARTLASGHASRFYISEGYAYKLLYRIMRERKQLTHI